MRNTTPPTLPPVLYVEDEDNDVLFMRRAFSKSGMPFPLNVARDGREGTEYLAAAAESGSLPVLVILDLNLPLVSGFQLLRWIRGNVAFDSTPVVVISSSSQESDLAQAKQHGANDYFVKPGTPSRLAELVKELHKRWLSHIA